MMYFFLLLVCFSPLFIGVFILGWQEEIQVRNKESGIEGRVFVGYCWTYFLFGFFVPIFRGEITVGLFHLILSLLTLGLFQLVMPFLYNKQYSIRLLTDSWVLNDNEEKNRVAEDKLQLTTESV
mgnify:CR=1 FL=1